MDSPQQWATSFQTPRLLLADKQHRQQLLQCSWFKRRWVVQEYGLTPYHSRFVLFGPALFPAEDLPSYIRTTGQELLPLSFDAFGLDPSNSLLYNLYRFDEALCTKPLDLIYSLLALSYDSPEIEAIQVDYAKTMEDSLVEVALSVVRCNQVKVERLSALLAIASAKQSCNNQPISSLPSWVPDWRVPFTYRFAEHESGVRFLFDVLGAERYPEGYYQKDAHHMNKHRHMEYWYPNRQRRTLSLRNVENLHLSIQGRLLTPCFPPAHESKRLLGGRETEHSIEEVVCWTCEIFSTVWAKLSPQAQEALIVVHGLGQVLFVLPHTSVVFVLRKVPALDGVYELAYCLDPECVKKSPHRPQSDDAFFHLHKWDKMFTKPDTIVLR